MSDTTSTATRRIPLRRLATILGVWAAVTGGAILVAHALDSPVGAGARDAAQAAPPGPVADPSSRPTDLPPLAMFLGRPLPADIAGLPASEQIVALRTRAMRTKSPERLVELGSLLQQIGDGASADFSYRSALRFDPTSVEARVGLALVDGATGTAGLARASRRLQQLAAENPTDQLVAFNLGWVEVYRRRGLRAVRAWERTVTLGPTTLLGETATRLLTTLVNSSSGRNP